MTPPVRPLQRYTATDQIYSELRGRIMMGGFAPGEAIQVGDTAAAFGVSAMPAREAIARLVAEGVLHAAPKKPARVPQLNRNRFREIVLLRTTLEPLALELAMAELDPGEPERLRALDKDMAQAIAAQDTAAYSKANFAFHFRLYQAAGHPLLLDMIERLWLLMGPTAKWYDRRGISIGSNLHQQLIEALEQRDVPAARGLLEQDIRSGTEFLLTEGELVADGPA